MPGRITQRIPNASPWHSVRQPEPGGYVRQGGLATGPTFRRSVVRDLRADAARNGSTHGRGHAPSTHQNLTLRLKQLGGIVLEFKGDDVTSTIVLFVREYGISHLMVGGPSVPGTSGGLGKRHWTSCCAHYKMSTNRRRRHGRQSNGLRNRIFWRPATAISGAGGGLFEIGDRRLRRLQRASVVLQIAISATASAGPHPRSLGPYASWPSRRSTCLRTG